MEWVAWALAIDPYDIPRQYNVARVYAKLGNFDPAFDLLEHLLPHANHETKSWIIDVPIDRSGGYLEVLGQHFGGNFPTNLQCHQQREH